MYSRIPAEGYLVVMVVVKLSLLLAIIILGVVMCDRRDSYVVAALVCVRRYDSMNLLS